MSEVRVKLPLPNAKLSPNSRVHWVPKSKLKKEHRTTSKVLALEQGVKQGDRFSSYRLEYHFKDRRRRDRDNAIASLKSSLDGIADACGQDDSEWDFDGVRIGDVDKQDPHVLVIFKSE